MGDAFATALDVLANPSARADAMVRAARELHTAVSDGLVRGAGDVGATVVALYERAAEQGSDEARSAIGDLFAHGAHELRVPRDEQRGLGALRAAALDGPREAVVRYVQASHGATTPAGKQFHADAAGMLNQLLTSDPDPELLVLAAWMLLSGHGYAADAYRARTLLERAAAAGSADALFELYVYGVRNIADVEGGEIALDRLRAAASGGSARAMANLGGRYATGEGVDRDVAEAVRWYERAAAAGSARAAYVLAVMFDSGRDVPRDAVRAAHYREAATRLQG